MVIALNGNPEVFQCKITGRMLSKSAFGHYQDRFPGGAAGFIVEILR
jgi:hypothetical protein